MLVRAAGIPVVSTLQSSVVLSLVALEGSLPAAPLPVMAVAILCVWAANCSSAQVSAPEPAPANESTTELQNPVQPVLTLHIL